VIVTYVVTTHSLSHDLPLKTELTVGYELVFFIDSVLGLIAMSGFGLDFYHGSKIKNPYGD